MGLGGIIAVWLLLAFGLLWWNKELFATIEMWRGLVIAVILTLCAPVFFLSDVLEMLLDFIAGEEEP